MRSTHSFFAASVLAITTLFGCSAPSSTSEAPTAQSESALTKGGGSCQGGRMWIPEGTNTWIEKDGSMGYQLPAGWSLVEEDEAGNLRLAAISGGKVTCTCTEGSGGCSPVSDGSSIGCLMSTCKTCSRSATRSFAVHLADAVRFSKADEWGTLPLATPSMFEVSELAKPLDEFLSLVAADAGVSKDSLLAGAPKSADGSDFAPPAGFVMIPINAFGRLVLVSVPEGYAMARVNTSAASASCKCNAGSGCKYWSKWGYSGCEAGSCTSCTMSTSIKVAGEESTTCASK